MAEVSSIILILIFAVIASDKAYGLKPIVVSTWNFPQAAKEAWHTLNDGGTSIEALVTGCSKCEEMQCDGTVGYGGSPDENGETTLDALIFDGFKIWSTMDMGAVAGLRRIKNAISVAKLVLQHTEHSLLVGSSATKFAVQMGFNEESLSTNQSANIFKQWVAKKCQPNFWKNVKPNPHESCGPYKPKNHVLCENDVNLIKKHHDTIGMITIDHFGDISAGTSTNGANHKIPGRVGDSPIAGAGAYADNSIGAAVGTGSGDVMMRFLPSFLAVEEMRNGKTPAAAAQVAINRIRSKYPEFFGAILAINTKGEYGAACNGMDSFPFCVMSPEYDKVRIERISCTK